MPNKVHAAFFRELYGRYSFNNVKEKLKLSDDEKAKSVLKSLKSAGIVKIVDKDTKTFDIDRLQEEIITDEISTDSNRSYVFNFVGIAYTENCVIKCFPKYIENESMYDAENADISHFKTVLQVLRKYNKTKMDNIKYFDLNSDKGKFNRMEIELFILEDFFENGIYSNQESIIETNGTGEIDWDRTINDTLAIIKNNKPYYVELQTINTQNDEQDYFKLLHECIVTECSNHLGKYGADVLDLFDMTSVELSSAKLSDFGDTEYIRYRIEQELRNQFVTQKQNLLKILHSYVSETEFGNQTSDFSFFGTNAFNMVWEKACSAIFSDVKDKYSYLIENAKWYFKDSEVKPIVAKDTLKPDTICLHKNHFYILDSKYYIYEKSEIQGLPGTQDILKQFAYHKAFYNYLLTSNIQNVSNSFLVPQKSSLWQNDKKSSNEGEVNIDLMQNYYLDRLAPIQLITLDPNYVFKNYLMDKKCMDLLLAVNPYKIGSQSEGDSAKQYCAVGYLRPEYFNKIKSENFQNFIFYYYQSLNKEVIEMHPDLPKCTKFIGYTDDKEYFIEGSVVGSLQIQDKVNLKTKLSNRGIEHEPTQSNYYCFDICDAKIVKKEELPQNFDSLLNSKENSTIKHGHSPKVISID